MTPSATDSYTTLAEALHERAQVRADEIAFDFVDPAAPGERGRRETSLTYSQLERRAVAVASRLRDLAAPGDRVLILCEPGAHYLAALFGSFYAGMVAVPAYPPVSADQDQRLRGLLADCESRVVLTSTLLSALYEEAGLERLVRGAGGVVVEIDSLPEQGSASEIHRGSGEDVAMLQYTSGSTGTPRGVILTYRNLLANVRAFEARIEPGVDDRGVSWLPPYHDMGLIGGIFSAVVTGIRTVSISPLLFLQDPLLWLEQISRNRATISGGPNFAYELCTRKATPERLEQLDLGCWRVAVNGAEPVRDRTMRDFAARFGSCGFDLDAFVPAYGLAEATLAVSMRAPAGTAGAGEPIAPDRSGPVALGRPVLGTTVAIADPEHSTRCAEGEVGEIWVSGPCVASGYWQDGGASAETFGALLADDPEGGEFLRTGDLGSVRDGELYVTGRLKDLIIVRGSNYYPQDIEETVGSLDERLRAGCTAAFQVEKDTGTETLVVVQECAGELSDTAAAELAGSARAAVASRHGIALDEIVFVARGGSLKTSSGKIRRRPTREAYERGTLPVIARVNGSGAAPSAGEPAPSAPSPTDVGVAFAAVLMVDSVPPDGDFFALGGDSLDVIELTVAVEEDFGARLEPRDVYRCPTPSSLARKIAEALERPPADGSSQLVHVLRDEIPRVGDRPSYPLSPIQRRWALDYLRDRSKTWGNLSVRVPLPDGGDRALMEKALAAIWQAHEALRTVFPGREESLEQRILERAEIPLALADLRDLDPAARPAAVAGAIREDASTVFDLATGPAARGTLIRTEESSSELHLALHHMLADGWSVIRLREQIVDAYAQLRAGASEAQIPEPPVRYRDYTAWLLDLESSGALSGSREYWLEQLDGDLPETLPVDDAAARSSDTGGASSMAILPTELAQRLRRHAKDTRLSLTALLYAAFFQVIHERTGGRDLIVGTPLAGRGRADIAETVGMFINLVPVRLRIRRGWDFPDLAEATQLQLLGAMTHQYYQLDRIVEDLEIEREEHRFPITNIFFTKLEMGLPLGDQPGARTASKMPIDVRFQLMMYAYEFTDGLVVECKYRDAVFSDGEVEDLMTAYIETLERAC